MDEIATLLETNEEQKGFNTSVMLIERAHTDFGTLEISHTGLLRNNASFHFIEHYYTFQSECEIS